MQQAFALLPSPQGLQLEIKELGCELLAQTPEQTVERQRNQLRGLGALVALLGLVFAPFHIALLGLVPLGVVVAAFGPRYIRQKVLFRIVKEPEECLITPLANVMTRSITCILGRYQTSGWDGMTRIAAILTDGAEVPILEIPATDEALARTVCEALSRLCRCGVEYTGAFGEVTRYGAAEL